MAETKTFYIQKLVRDKMQSQLEAENASCVSKTLSDSEYSLELKKKVVEEAREVSSATTRENLIEEVADVFEVLEALIKLENISKEEITAYRIKKNDGWGKFEKRLWIETITAPINSEECEYLSRQPDKYKEKK